MSKAPPDLAEDPKYSATRARLTKMLDQWIAETNDRAHFGVARNDSSGKNLGRLGGAP